MKIFLHTTNPKYDGVIITDYTILTKMLGKKYIGPYKYHFDILDDDTYIAILLIYKEIPNLAIYHSDKASEFLLNEFNSMLTEYYRYLPKNK